MSAAHIARIFTATAVAISIVGCATAPKKNPVPSGTPGIAIQAMGTDGLRVVFPGDSSGFTNAFVLTSTNANYAGRRVVMTTYVAKESTRHLILMYYPETGLTQCHTYVTVRLAEAIGPDPTAEVPAHKAKSFLNQRYVGKKVYVNATSLCSQGCMVGTIYTRAGENIGAALVDAGLAQSAKGQRPACAPHDDKNLGSGYSYNVIDAMVEGKALTTVGDMPAAKPPTPKAAPETPASDEGLTDTPAAEEGTTEAPASEEAATETPAAEEGTTETPAMEETQTEAPAPEEAN